MHSSALLAFTLWCLIAGASPISRVDETKIRLDHYLQIVLSRVEGTPVYSSDVDPEVELRGTLVLPLVHMDLTLDGPRLTTLVESGIWQNPDGARYDMRSVTMFLPNGSGEPLDAIASMGKTRLRFATAADCNTALARTKRLE